MQAFRGLNGIIKAQRRPPQSANCVAPSSAQESTRADSSLELEQDATSTSLPQRGWVAQKVTACPVFLNNLHTSALVDMREVLIQK